MSPAMNRWRITGTLYPGMRSRTARPGDSQRDAAARLVHRHARLPPDVLLAEIVPVVSADDHRGVRPQSVAFDGVRHAPEPAIDHRQLRAVARPELVRLAVRQHAL